MFSDYIEKIIYFLLALAISVSPIIANGGPYDVPKTIPDTGQTQCYDTNGNVIPCPSEGEDYYGQDANYTISPMSYTKLRYDRTELPDSATFADGWVMTRDNVTGMIWEVKQGNDGTKNYTNPHDVDNEYTWYDPDPATNGGDAGTESAHDTLDFITELNNANFGGYSDWRMPSREELRSIMDYSIPYPGPTVDTEFFPNIGASYYWSSTTDAGNTSNAWSVYFDYGGFDYGKYKSDGGDVRAVRGGQ